MCSPLPQLQELQTWMLPATRHRCRFLKPPCRSFWNSAGTNYKPELRRDVLMQSIHAEPSASVEDWQKNHDTAGDGTHDGHRSLVNQTG